MKVFPSRFFFSPCSSPIAPAPGSIFLEQTPGGPCILVSAGYAGTPGDRMNAGRIPPFPTGIPSPGTARRAGFCGRCGQCCNPGAAFADDAERRGSIVLCRCIASWTLAHVNKCRIELGAFNGIAFQPATGGSLASNSVIGEGNIFTSAPPSAFHNTLHTTASSPCR